VHAWAEVCHLSQSSKSVFMGFLSRCMQYWLKNHWPGSVQTLSQHWMTKPLPVSMHTNCISNSAILSKNSTLSSAPAHHFFITVKSHEALQTGSLFFSALLSVKHTATVMTHVYILHIQTLPPPSNQFAGSVSGGSRGGAPGAGAPPFCFFTLFSSTPN